MKHTLSFMDEKVHVSLVTNEANAMYSIAWSRELTHQEKRTLRQEFFEWRMVILQALADKHGDPIHVLDQVFNSSLTIRPTKLK